MAQSTVLGNTIVYMPGDTSANRPTPAAGMMRFNTTINLMEYYDGTIWKAIDSPPIITSISPTTYNGASGTTITINGSNFQSGIVAAFVAQGGATVNAGTTTRVSSSQLTATTPQAYTVANGPLGIKVTNPSGLNVTLVNALSTGGAPNFSTAAGSLGTIYDSTRTGNSYTISATDPDSGGTVTLSLISGAVPTGMTWTAGTGVINGTPSAVGTDTTSSFTIRATDNAGNTTDRTFSITVKAPVVVSFTSPNSGGTWGVPSGLSTVQLLVVAGGGGGGGATGFESGGGGGAGGLLVHPAYPLAPHGGAVPYYVGGGGGAGTNGGTAGSNGSPSYFGNSTANGGGYGGGQYWYGNPGGSGGGQAGNNCGGLGSATQGPSGGGTGYGNNGGSTSGYGGGGSQACGAGGGGAGGVGGNGQNYSSSGYGGPGLSYSISGSSVTYAGGGGGAPSQNGTNGGPGGSGGGGNPNGGSGTAYTGGGGAGGCATPGGTGGSGIIYLKY
jgi:hypothetical protein